MLKKIIVSALLSASFPILAQEKAEQALKIFEEKYPQEKIHLLFDKKSYVAGENLWFKSYVFSGYSPTSISTSLFVELYDQNKTLLDKKLIPLVNGEGQGNFVLSENLKENVYYVRAYTTWSTNFSEEFQAIRSIEVYNPSSPEKLILNTASSAWTATVHPESNSFIEGIDTKFAVRLHSRGIQPSIWNGYVTEVSKPDVKITAFKGFDENTGVFRLSPESGKKYQLTVEDDKGLMQTIALPEVASSGIHLKVESNPDAVRYSLQSKNISQEPEFYTVIGTINDQTVYKAKISKLSDKIYSIPTNKLVNGILQLSIFDDSYNLLSQRMCFVEPKHLQPKKTELSKLSLNAAPRSQNSFNIANSPDTSSYTVVVLDGESKSSEDENSLLSTLLLTGDISTDVNSPTQYFKKGSNPEALDAILISEKWKRFDWKKIISGNYPVVRNATESNISYKGKVTISGQPAINTDMNIIFTMPNYGTKFYPIKTDSNGYFTLKGLAFEDSIKFSYQLNDKKIPNEQLQVVFQPIQSFVPLRRSLPESNYILQARTSEDHSETAKYKELQSTLKNLTEKTILLEEVKIKQTKKDLTKKLNQELSSPFFKSYNEVVFDFVNDTNPYFSNILSFLEGRVSGLQIQTQGFNAVASYRGHGVLFYLDEIKTDAEILSNISADNIAMVKIIKEFYSGLAAEHSTMAIAVYTRRGNMSNPVNNSSQKSILKQSTLKGYDKTASFSSPDYSNAEYNNITKDTRSVLYWNPSLEVQSKEPVKVEFYNNDAAKNYRIIIIGYDPNHLLPTYYDNLLN